MASKRRTSSQPVKKRPAREQVAPSAVRLERGKGSKGRGDGPGGAYWHVFVGEQRVGNVYINVIDEPPVGKHASIQIQLNVSAQGRGIASVAYGLAVKASEHDVVYAHMRKSNIASRKAAEHSGFVAVEDPGTPQMLMVWRRQS
jgi:hypothetical protein